MAQRKAGQRGARSSAKKTSAAAKKKADAAAAAAKEAKAVGRRLTAARQALRDSMIVARAAQGVPQPAIAAEAGVDVRTVQRVIRDRRGVKSPLEEAPMELLEELAVGYRLAIGDYEALALAWMDTNQSAALGAKKAADETRARLAQLMADVGKLPSNLELFRSEMEMLRIAREMHEVVRDISEGRRPPEDAMEFFRRLVSSREQAALEAGAK